jgi:hypothetical protein
VFLVQWRITGAAFPLQALALPLNHLFNLGSANLATAVEVDCACSRCQVK